MEADRAQSSFQILEDLSVYVCECKHYNTLNGILLSPSRFHLMPSLNLLKEKLYLLNAHYFWPSIFCKIDTDDV